MIHSVSGSGPGGCTYNEVQFFWACFFWCYFRNFHLPSASTIRFFHWISVNCIYFMEKIAVMLCLWSELMRENLLNKTKIEFEFMSSYFHNFFSFIIGVVRFTHFGLWFSVEFFIFIHFNSYYSHSKWDYTEHHILFMGMKHNKTHTSAND